MKKYLLIFLAVLMSGAAFADDAVLPLSARINVSPDLGKAQCAQQPGKGLKIVWKGVSDARHEKAVGSLKKGKEESEVFLAGDVDATVGSALKTVFANCGFEVASGNGDGIKTTADLTEFFAGSKKGFFTGQTDAKGALTLHFVKGTSSYDFNLGATKSDKRLRKKGMKQIEEVLTALLEAIVVQIGESPSLFEELRKMGE